MFSARLHASMREAKVRAVGRQERACMSSSTWKARCSCPARPASVMRPCQMGRSGATFTSCAASAYELSGSRSRDGSIGHFTKQCARARGLKLRLNGSVIKQQHWARAAHVAFTPRYHWTNHGFRGSAQAPCESPTRPAV